MQPVQADASKQYVRQGIDFPEFQGNIEKVLLPRFRRAIFSTLR